MTTGIMNPGASPSVLLIPWSTPMYLKKMVSVGLLTRLSFFSNFYCKLYSNFYRLNYWLDCNEIFLEEDVGKDSTNISVSWVILCGPLSPGLPYRGAMSINVNTYPPTAVTSVKAKPTVINEMISYFWPGSSWLTMNIKAAGIIVPVQQGKGVLHSFFKKNQWNYL